MKALLIGLREMLIDFVLSKKVLTAILTSVAALVIKDPDTRKYVVETGVGLLVAQGITDHGKAAAVTMAAAGLAPVPLTALTRSPTAPLGIVVTEAPMTPPAPPVK